MQCPNCKTAVLEVDRFCEECGVRLVADAPGCVKCGATELDSEGFCLQCGFRREAQDRTEIICSDRLVGISDRGLKHNRNEDAFAIQQIDQASILVVCDGVSSSHDANRASQLAAKTVCEQLMTLIASRSPETALKAAIEQAQLAVSQLANASDSEPPSTTIVAVVVKDQVATIASLGDSRAYWIDSSDSLISKQLTEDDSWLNQVVRSGEMSQLEAQHSPNAHAITRWLGADALDDINLTIVTFPVPTSGHLLLCTDGLWNYASTVQHLFAFVQSVSQQNTISIARTLVDHALSRGGHDNITVAILSI